jgi:hypothetical protein
VRDPRTIAVTCAGCGSRRHIRVGLVLVVERAGVMHLMWPCESCVSGYQAVTHPAAKSTAWMSGSAIRSAALPTGWPEMPRPVPTTAPPMAARAAPLSRLARLVNRHPKPIEGEP